MYNNLTLITNFPISEEEIYREAIKRFGDPNLSICDNAYDAAGVPIAGYKSLHHSQRSPNVTLTKFWDIYNDICAETGYDIYAVVSELLSRKLSDVELKVRQYSADICDVFEDLLEKHDITIPSDDCEGDEAAARLYGSEYSDVEDAITEILINFLEDFKKNPDVEINSEEY